MREGPKTEPGLYLWEAESTEGSGVGRTGQLGQGTDYASCLPSAAFRSPSAFHSSLTATNRKLNTF